MDTSKFNITKSLVCLFTKKNVWIKELNLVSCNDMAPKYDIRSCSPEHQNIGKCASIPAEEPTVSKNAFEELI